MSGWSELGAMLGGGAQMKQQAYQSGVETGARQADLLEQARQRRDENLGLQAITPQAVASVVSGADPVTGQAFDPAALSALQGGLVSAMFHAKMDPRQLSGYQKDEQSIGFKRDAMAAAVDPSVGQDSLNRRLMVLAGKPVELTHVTDGVAFNPMATPDSQTIGATPVGLAEMMLKGAQAHAADASAGEHAAHARLFDTQTAAGGFNPHAGVEPSLGGAMGLGASAGGATGDAFLQTLPANDASTVKALAEGRMAFPSGAALKAPYWQNMLAAVGQYDPSFEAANFQARSKTRNDFTSGKSAQTINSLNTVLGHMGDLSDAADKLNNTGLPWWNSVANATLSAAGDQRIKEFEANKKAVVDEMTRVYRGTGGSEQDIKSWSEALDAAGSPAQLQGVIGKISELLQSKINALTDQYHQGMGTIGQHQSFISPKAQSTLQKLEQRAGMHYSAPADVGAPALGDAGATVPAAPAAPAPSPTAAAPAYRAVDPHTGHAVVWNGSAWVSEQ